MRFKPLHFCNGLPVTIMYNQLKSKNQQGLIPTLLRGHASTSTTAHCLKNTLALSAALLLTACGADVSNEIVIPAPNETALSQCEVPEYGVIGTVTDPIIIDGVETRACIVNEDVGQIHSTTDVTGLLNPVSISKSSWNYEPLAWIWDGIYEFGNNKEYANLAELIEDRSNYTGGGYVTEDTVFIVHRNAHLASTSFIALDDNGVTGGSWGGIIVNGIGYHPDCPANTSAEHFCNIKGPFGYYGGVGLNEDLSAYGMAFVNAPTVHDGLPGYSGTLTKAGKLTAVSLSGHDGGTINASITAYAPFQLLINTDILDSAGTGLRVEGGGGSPIPTTEDGIYIGTTEGPAVELNNFYGNLSVGTKRDNHEPVIIVKGGDATLTRSTLFDQYLTSEVAVEVTDAARLTLDNVVIEGFEACLQIQDASSIVNISTTLFNCNHSTAAASNGADYGAAALASASDFIENMEAELTPFWQIGNETLAFSHDLRSFSVSSVSSNGYKAIQYPVCLGIGTLSGDTVTINNVSHKVCDLNSQINQSAKLYRVFDTDNDNDYDADTIAWRINGQVQFGNDLTALSDAEQLAALEHPIKIIVTPSTQLFAAANTDAELVLQPSSQLFIQGSLDNPIELAATGSLNGDVSSLWRGISVNGWAAQCSSSAECELANAEQIQFNYVRLFDTGANGQPALTLNGVGNGSAINYLDIVGSGGGGLAINGGAVNIDHLIMAKISGDYIAWSNGYTGTVQEAILQADADISLGHALYGINNLTTPDAEPRSRPVFTNITALGTSSSDSGILLDAGSGLILYNSVVTGFDTCLDIDGAETAAQQTSTPANIAFESVVLDCDATLASDDEDAGYDYGYTTQQSSGVAEVEAVIDSHYVATGSDVPTFSAYNEALVGTALTYLDSYNSTGAVADLNDTWYQTWSDSVFIQLAAECDYKGVLEGNNGYYSQQYIDTETYGGNAYVPFKICGLRGTITEDFELTAYTGADKVAFDNGELLGGIFYSSDGFSEDFQYYEPTQAFVPLPTLWLLNGMVHVGTGHKLLTTIEEVAELKANPVTLTIDNGAVVMASGEQSGLHITRGGYLQINGSAHYVDVDNTNGMVSILGFIDVDGSDNKLHYNSSRSWDLLGPLDKDVSGWQGLIIDGFGRHNQCPDADTTAANTGVCNIAGKYGYYGGYDNDHVNFDINYLFLDNATLAFNAAGNGLANGLILGGDDDEGIINPGASHLVMDGGAANIKQLYIEPYRGNYIWGSALEWNHGYQGTIQNVSMKMTFTDETPIVASDNLGADNFYPMIQGRNIADSDTSGTDALPRSAPTLANMTIYIADKLETLSSIMSLTNGSGLFMYNSVLGSDDSIYNSSYTSDYCLLADDTTESLIDSSVVLHQVAYGCAEFSNNPGNGLNLDDQLNASSQSDIRYHDWVIGSTRTTLDDFDEGVVEGVVRLTLTDPYYPAVAVMLGDNQVYDGTSDEQPIDYSSSTTVDTNVIENTNYLGIADYLTIWEAGQTIGD